MKYHMYQSIRRWGERLGFTIGFSEVYLVHCSTRHP